MFKLVLSDRFKKNLQNFIRKHPELTGLLEEKFSILQNNFKDRRLRSHKLTGKLKGFLAASITHEYRIVFYLENDSIFLIAIGTHDEVY